MTFYEHPAHKGETFADLRVNDKGEWTAIVLLNGQRACSKRARLQRKFREELVAVGQEAVKDA